MPEHMRMSPYDGSKYFDHVRTLFLLFPTIQHKPSGVEAMGLTTSMSHLGIPPTCVRHGQCFQNTFTPHGGREPLSSVLALHNHGAPFCFTLLSDT